MRVTACRWGGGTPPPALADRELGGCVCRGHCGSTGRKARAGIANGAWWLSRGPLGRPSFLGAMHAPPQSQATGTSGLLPAGVQHRMQGWEGLLRPPGQLPHPNPGPRPLLQCPAQSPLPHSLPSWERPSSSEGWGGRPQGAHAGRSEMILAAVSRENDGLLVWEGPESRATLPSSPHMRPTPAALSAWGP